jgi:FtsZ-binding cell division protein ZapB
MYPEKSLLSRIESLTSTNKKLREENSTLRRRLETALGDLREVQQRIFQTK